MAFDAACQAFDCADEEEKKSFIITIAMHHSVSQLIEFCVCSGRQQQNCSKQKKWHKEYSEYL